MTTPRRYQLKGVAKVERLKGRCLIADDMGLGKSFEALLYAHNHPEMRPVLVICPANLKENWRRECYKHFNIMAEVLCGRTPPRKGFRRFAPITIVNYDILEAWYEYLTYMAPELVIVDEGQYVCNFEAKRTRLVHGICEGVPCVLVLTGTPISNRPAELYPLVHLVKPTLFKSRMAFLRRYCRPQLKPWGWEFKGAERLPELHGILEKHVMLRRTKEDVLTQLPKQQINVVPVPVDDRKEYDKALNSFLVWVARNYGKGRARKAAQAEKLVQMTYLMTLAARLKMKYVCSWIDDYLRSTEDKLALFTIHREVSDILVSRYPKISTLLDGRTPQTRRMEVVDRFNDNPKCRLGVFQIKAAGAGFSLKAPSCAVVEFPWAPATLAQAIARIHGLGRGVKGRVSSAYLLCATDTIEEKLLAVVQEKQGISRALIDGQDFNDLDLFDRLIKELVKEAKR